MPVQATLNEVKVAIKFSKGAQTISKCNKEATDENLLALGQAVGALNQEIIEKVTKIEETALTQA